MDAIAKALLLELLEAEAVQALECASAGRGLLAISHFQACIAKIQDMEMDAKLDDPATNPKQIDLPV